MKGYADLSKLPEDKRIQLIGETIMAEKPDSGAKPIMIGVFVDDDVVADRYIKKLADTFPKVRVIDRKPSTGAILIRFGGPLR